MTNGNATFKPADPSGPMSAALPPSPEPRGAIPRPPWQRAGLRLMLHAGFLVIAIGCFAAWLHLSALGHSTASTISLVSAAVFGLAPLRDIVQLVFKVEGKALHLVHLLGGLGLVALPLTGMVSGAPVLSHAAMAPFAMMGAAQALMHSQQPRNATQA